MTSTELTPQQKFEEKVKAKLKENIGDLMPEDVLKAMIEKAMLEMFFTKKIETKQSGWQTHNIEKPSWFEEEVSTLLKETIRGYVKEAVEGEKETLKKIAVELVTEKLPDFIVNNLIQIVQAVTLNQSYTAANDIRQNLANKGINV